MIYVLDFIFPNKVRIYKCINLKWPRQNECEFVLYKSNDFSGTRGAGYSMREVRKETNLSLAKSLRRKRFYSFFLPFVAVLYLLSCVFLLLLVVVLYLPSYIYSCSFFLSAIYVHTIHIACNITVISL